MFAIVDAYRAGLLKKNNWLPNITAGLIVGVVALPLAMAFAIASGATPVQGLYTAIVAALMVGLFGGSRVQIAGPTGAFIVILAGITARYGISGLQVATLMAGFILLFMGAMRLGSVIKYIPDPVIVGFTSGIGVIIFVGEWKDFFGLTVHIPLDAKFYQKFLALVQALPHLNIATTLLALLSLVLVIVTPKLLKKIPGPLVAMIIATALQSFFHFKNVATLGSAFGEIPQRLPHFQLPSLSFASALELIGPAFTIALLGAIESLLSATAADGMAHTRHNSNQELIGQGIANILCPLFGGFAATGAIARTATNIRNGGNSPISAIIHSILLILILIFLAPLANNIPLCCLAAILFVVSYNMSDVPHFKHMLKCAPSYDVVILLLTFFLTVFTNLVIAVNLGVIFAMLFFIRRMNQAVKIEAHTKETLQANGVTSLPEGTMVYDIQGPFFFGAAEKIESALAATHADPKIIIFRLKDVPFMDMTGLETFQELLTQYHQRGVKIYLCEVNTLVQNKLEKLGIFSLLQGKKNFATLHEVIQDL
jgi:SulP family sulfate permease